MKKLNMFRSIILLFLVCFLFSETFASGGKKKGFKTDTGSFLVVGFHNNLNSNYYPKIMIAEKMGIQAQVLDTLINSLFLREMVAVRNPYFNFINPSKDINYISLIKELEYSGKNEEKYTNLSDSSNIYLNKLIEKYNVDYVIFFSQYFLKKQEEPFPTLFHIINYSILNPQKEELVKGKLHTNTYDLIDLNEFEVLLKKNAKKYISSIEKEIR